MPRATLRFSHHSCVFSLIMVGFYTVMGCFLYSPPDCRRTYPVSVRDVPLQADIPRVFLQPCHIQSRDCTTVHHPAATQHAFERVTTQELLHHLCIAHFRHWFRLIHPQSTVHLRQLLSTHPVGKEPEVPHHLKKRKRQRSTVLTLIYW